MWKSETICEDDTKNRKGERQVPVNKYKNKKAETISTITTSFEKVQAIEDTLYLWQFLKGIF
jgi:hypothetical protein